MEIFLINNYKYKPEKNLTPVHYKRKINKKDKLMSNKTFDENDIKSYKDIMMEISRELSISQGTSNRIRLLLGMSHIARESFPMTTVLWNLCAIPLSL